MMESTSEPVNLDIEGTSNDSLQIYTSNLNLQNKQTNNSSNINSTIVSNNNKLSNNSDCLGTDFSEELIRINKERKTKTELDDKILHNDIINTEHEDKTKNDGKKRTYSEKIEDRLSEKGIQRHKRPKVNIFLNDTMPQWYHVRGALVTPPVSSKNFPKAFEGLPIYGKPKCKADLESFQTEKLRKFIGCDLDDDEFDELSKYCSPDNLKTGVELSSKTRIPIPGILPFIDGPKPDSNINLNILKKCKLRMEKDSTNKFTTKLKYRAVRLISQSHEDNTVPQSETQLEPGRDVLYHVRLYRPYSYIFLKERSTRGRHSVFSFDLMLSGRQFLSALRDRIVCHNDMGMRVDVSSTPDAPLLPTAKDVFPSGFLFINNVFYVDTREGCSDTSEVIREWALKRGMGAYTKRDMCAVRLDDIVLKLGYPEVYMHQGNCEHVFTFSEMRLVSPRDPLRVPQYPYVVSVSQNQTIYCTTCAEFGAKWVAVGCRSVPFDPTFFCDMCFRQYMYKDGNKIGDFKAYTYRGNEINMLKPQA